MFAVTVVQNFSQAEQFRVYKPYPPSVRDLLTRNRVSWKAISHWAAIQWLIISERSEMMRSFRFSVAILVSTLPTFVFAQIAGLESRSTPAAQDAQNVTVLNGRVQAEGSSLPEPANVLLACDNQVRAETYSDKKGNFSFTIYLANQSSASSMATARAAISTGQWMGCELYAEIPGYFSEHLRLSERPRPGNVDVGTIPLHTVPSDARSSGDPRFTVSVTSLAAPEKARKAFSKGEQEVRKGKFQAACDYFKQAVATYPRYALAWLELGRVQARENSFVDAEASFRQAVTQDSKLTDGYVELARVAAQQQNWKAVADASDNLVQLSPDSSPEYWFLNAAAYYNLGDMKQAESSITHAIRLDIRHQVVQTEYLYGLILGSKKDYKSASEHISNYLRGAPNSKDAATARKALDVYQQRSQMADAEQH
jgi:Flp pilus assembly protein TadD